MVEFNLKLFLVELSTISRTNLIRIENKNSWFLSFERLNVKEKSDDAVNILCCCQGYNARKVISDLKIYEIFWSRKLLCEISKLSKEPVKSFVGMFRKMKISLYDN